MSSYIPESLRKLVAKRANFTCEYCLISQEDTFYFAITLCRAFCNPCKLSSSPVGPACREGQGLFPCDEQGCTKKGYSRDCTLFHAILSYCGLSKLYNGRPPAIAAAREPRPYGGSSIFGSVVCQLYNATKL